MRQKIHGDPALTSLETRLSGAFRSLLSSLFSPFRTPRSPPQASDRFARGEDAPAVHAFRTSGVSLIIVLGILLLISLIVLSFVRITHDARDTAQLATERLRSDHLLHSAVGRAMEDVNRRLTNRLFYWSAADPGDLAVNLDCIVSTNGTTNASAPNILTVSVLPEIPPAIVGEVSFMVTNACQWIPTEGGPSGRYAYVVVNLSGLLDVNRVGGGSSSNRTDPVELDLSPMFNTTTDTNIFFAERVRDVRYETRAEFARLNTAATSHWENAQDVFTVFSYDPDSDVFYVNATNIGTRFFTNALRDKVCISTTNHSGLVSILTNDISNPELVASGILDYQDEDRFLNNTNWITEALPLVTEILIDTNSSPSNLLVTLETWFPFHPPPTTNDAFRIIVSVTTDLANATYRHDLYLPDVSTFPIYAVPIMKSPGSNLCLSVDLQWSNTFFSASWTNMYTLILLTSDLADFSINDPRMPTNTSSWTTQSPSSNTIGRMNDTICQPCANGGHGLPIYHPDRPMQNIGEIGYIWTGEPWRSLDLTQTNVAALLDKFTARTNLHTPRHGLVSAGSTNFTVWQTIFLGIPLGKTNTTCSFAGMVTTNDAMSFADYMSSPSADVFHNYAELLSGIGSHGSYSNFLLGVANVGADQREDVLRGIVELLSFRHQLYLVVVAAQTLAADGRTMTADRRSMALVWRDGYTGQYFVRNFRWITD
jgi:hypothetical protein